MLMVLNASYSLAQTEFITTWKTDNPGSSNSTSITIPTFSAETYNYDVDWNNDGVFDDNGVTGNITHDFGMTGTYTIRIRGTFPRIYFLGAGDRNKIISVGQWGTMSWSSMSSAFRFCENLVFNASDVPDLSQVSDMSDMLSGASSFNQDINFWDTSNVMDMSSMFSDATSFNQQINFWDTSNVTNMQFMFSGATSFNQDLSDWDTSNVTDMNNMFSSASSFNQDVTAWNTSSVTNMSAMFAGASIFDQNLSSWNVENVTNFFAMFSGVALSNSNYEALIISWNSQNLQPNLTFDAGNSQYCTQSAADAKTNIIASYGWMFVDGGACATLGIENPELQNLISIYPNPSSRVIAIHGLTEKVSVAILDITGKQVYKNPNYNNEEIITIDHLQSGMYVVQVINKKGNTSLKLIKD